MNWTYARAMLAALLIASPLAAQRDDDDYRSRIDTTVNFDRAGTVDLSLVSGEIVVSSWDKNSVRVKATSERGVLRLDASSLRLTLTVRSEHGNLGDTRYEVTIPNGARLIARSVSGDIRSRGGSEVEARSVSGDVEVTDVSGRATLESVSGTVRGARIAGGLRANAVSGDLDMSDITGDVDVQTVSGEIGLGSVTSSYVSTQTVSGDVTFTGKIDPKGRYDFHAHSGDVRITLPPTLPGASFSVETFSGDVESACKMTLTPNDVGRRHGQHIEFTIGSGGAHFTIQTFSGDVRIEGCGASKKEE